MKKILVNAFWGVVIIGLMILMGVKGCQNVDQSIKHYKTKGYEIKEF